VVVGILPAHLLGGHVPDRAEGGADLRQRSPGVRGLTRRVERRHPRETEIENLDAAIPRDEDVVGFEIAMSNALLVCRGEAVRDLDRVLDRLSHRHSAGIADRGPFQQLGDNERCTVMHADVEHREHIRMIQRGDGARLALEALQAIGIGGESARQNFDRHVASESRVGGSIDLSHATGTEETVDLVRSETRSGWEGQIAVDYIGWPWTRRFVRSDRFTRR
jgi:hypothetical protein